ncbi:hypothetical protein [Streptomyces hokutonensis]|uniref:hypothetical protein n=1 Tax=Streptomyces hokutonensis TaxID=1306990 RepID=UPI0033C6DABD
MASQRPRTQESADQAQERVLEPGRTDAGRAMRVLARDPFRKTSTAQLGPEEHLRKAYVAPGVVVEYMVAGTIMVVVVLEIFDESHYLIDENDAT